MTDQEIADLVEWAVDHTSQAEDVYVEEDARVSPSVFRVGSSPHPRRRRLVTALTDVAFDFRLTALELSYQRTIALAEALRCEASGMRLSAACARRRADVLGAVPGVMLWMAGHTVTRAGDDR